MADTQYPEKVPMRCSLNEIKVKDVGETKIIECKAGVAPNDLGNEGNDGWLNLDVTIWPGKKTEDPEAKIQALTVQLEAAQATKSWPIFLGTAEERSFTKKDGSTGTGLKMTVYLKGGIYLPTEGFAGSISEAAGTAPAPVEPSVEKPVAPALPARATRGRVRAPVVTTPAPSVEQPALQTYPSPADLVRPEQIFVVKALNSQDPRLLPVPTDFRNKLFNPPTGQRLAEIITVAQGDELIRDFYHIAAENGRISKEELASVTSYRTWLVEQLPLLVSDELYGDALGFLNSLIEVKDDNGAKVFIDDYLLAALAVPMAKIADAKRALQSIIHEASVVTEPDAIGVTASAV